MNDPDGLSFYLEDEVSAEELCEWGRGDSYFVSRHQVKDLRGLGLSVVRKEDLLHPGHVVTPELNTGNRKSEAAVAIQLSLAKSGKVLGPLPGGGSAGA